MDVYPPPRKKRTEHGFFPLRGGNPKKDMDREQAQAEMKGFLRQYVESITTASRKAGRGMYVCPLCGSGTGKGKTGAFSITNDGLRWKCFACNQSGDVFDLIGLHENLTGYPAQMKRASELFGVPYDSSDAGDYRSKSGQHTHTSMQTNTYTQEKVDFSGFFAEAHANIGLTDYPQMRGLSTATINRFKLGYVAEWRHPKVPATVPTTPRLIIPTSRYSYLARDTRSDIPEEQKQYKQLKAGKAHFFNVRALKEATTPIFVVEGEIDAMSIIEAGGEAVALGSVSMVEDFLKVVRATPPQLPLIIAMDNDARGEQAANELQIGLGKAGILSSRCNPALVWKDANEALLHDRENFCACVLQAIAYAKEEYARRMTEEKEQYLQNSAACHMEAFKKSIRASVASRAVSTGFYWLDRRLSDTHSTSSGLYEGLYIVGAISSLGKTTLIMQIADQIAQSEQDVLIFSLEMARSEIMAKSISRHTFKLAVERGVDTAAAKSSRGITCGDRYATYSPLEHKLIEDAMAAYSSYAGHVFILEGVGDIGVAQVRSAVEEHTKKTGSAPVVVVDYLQIMAPSDPRMTDKQNTDKAVMELKRISRDYNVPVIAISSLNRQSYSRKISMEAFKESGAIEYSSDVLIGLQLKGVGESNFDVDQAKSKNPRDVELVILKNRNGQTGETVKYKYYPMFNYFKEDS